MNSHRDGPRITNSIRERLMLRFRTRGGRPGPDWVDGFVGIRSPDGVQSFAEPTEATCASEPTEPAPRPKAR